MATRKITDGWKQLADHPGLYQAIDGKIDIHGTDPQRSIPENVSRGDSSA
jgi:hypothetical protein